MGSLVVKIDRPTSERLKNRYHYEDIDILTPRHMPDGEVPMAYDVEAVKMSIRNILMWRVGESVLRPEFGHNINQSMYEQLNEFTKDKVCEEIKRAIEENEPRVDVVSVGVKSDAQDSDNDDNNTLHVKVVYTVKGDKTKDAEFTTYSELKMGK